MPNYNEDEVDKRTNQGSTKLDDINKRISSLQKAIHEVKALRLQFCEEKSKLSSKSSDNSEVKDGQESLEKAVTRAFRVCVDSDDESDSEESDYETCSDDGNIENTLSSKSSDSSELENQLLSTENAVANAASRVVEDSHVNSDDESDDSEESDHESSSHEDNHLVTDDSEGDDDARAACFPCPFCYVDIEVHGLCSHLQEEHCFDLKNAVCPLCAANFGKDVIEHFIVQHASSLKRRRKSQKSGFLNGSSVMLGKELSLFLGSSTNGRGNAHESAPDPLLSPFLCSEPLSDLKGIRQDECSNNSASVTADLKSFDEGHEQDNEEKRQRAAFVQELIVSTIF